MKVEFKESFARDLRNVKGAKLLGRVRELIEAIEQAGSLDEITHLKKLRGGKDFYRVRVGDYRLGLLLKGSAVTFVRFLHRKEIYRYFP